MSVAAPTVARMWHPWRENRDDEDFVIGFRDDLPSGISWWVPEVNTVLIKKGLKQVDSRCALTHELGHRELGIAECVPPEDYPDASRQERRDEMLVDSWAAHKLIEFADLVKAARWATCRDEVAEELWVTPRLLTVRLERMPPWEKRMLEIEGVKL